MPPITLEVPTLNDDPWHFDVLFSLWRRANAESLDVTFRFSSCGFLKQNAVAFLGGLARLVEYRGGRVSFDWHSLQDRVRVNLAQQGFLAAFGCPGGPWTGNSIPYREDHAIDKAGLMDYLKTKWLGRGWINVSPRLRDAIVGRVWEIYENAFEHSNSPIGLFSCGQHFPNKRRLLLTVVDFGVGIPANVRSFFGDQQIRADHALAWAFQPGTTTKPNGMGRGVGLDLLRQFVTLNNGWLEVFSHDARSIMQTERSKIEARAGFFEGTIVNIGLRCDDSYYCLSSEATPPPLF
jgi:hypothetical protein